MEHHIDGVLFPPLGESVLIDVGVAGPVVSVTAVRTVSFSVYQKAKYASSDFIGRMTGKDEPLVVVNKPGSVPTAHTVACFGFAGASAGAASTFIACEGRLQGSAAHESLSIARSI